MRRPATVHEYAAAPAFNETVSVLTRPAGTLLRALTTKNAAERPLRFAIRKTTFPAAIARGDTPHEARLIVTLTVACVAAPSAIPAMARSAIKRPNAAKVRGRVRVRPSIARMILVRAQGILKCSPPQAHPREKLASASRGHSRALARPKVRYTGAGGDHTYGVVVVTGVKPRRSRIGRLSAEASVSRYRKPRATARLARWATSAR